MPTSTRNSATSTSTRTSSRAPGTVHGPPLDEAAPRTGEDPARCTRPVRRRPRSPEPFPVPARGRGLDRSARRVRQRSGWTPQAESGRRRPGTWRCRGVDPANGATNVVDRTHTALHGHVLALCEDAGIKFDRETTIAKALNLLRKSHPALAASGPRADNVTLAGSRAGRWRVPRAERRCSPPRGRRPRRPGSP